MTESPTLKAIRMEWVVTLSTVETFSFLGGIAIGFIAALLGHRSDYLAIGACTGLITSFVLTFVYFYIFYNRVKCPLCHGKLNRFQNGKRVPGKQAHTQLKSGYGCRHCGWKPDQSRAVAPSAP
jgi:hypothetical protein